MQMEREITPIATGSQTATAVQTPQREEETPPIVLQLQAVSRQEERRVTWDSEVVDNENMGKKSSKGESFACVLLRRTESANWE